MVAANRHDISVIQVYDKRDTYMPNIGLVQVRDAETGQRLWADTAMASVRNAYREQWQTNQRNLQSLLTKTGTRNVSVATDGDYVKALMSLFKQ